MHICYAGFTSAVLVFVAAAQGMPFDGLALVARGGARISGSCGTVAVGEIVLGKVPPPGH